MPRTGSRLLSLDEIARLLRAFATLGMRKLGA